MKDKITLKNELGEEKKFDILFTFDSKETNKTYIVYTDYSKDYKGNLNCYSGYYENEEFLPVTSEKELNFINETLNTLTSSILEKYSENKE